MQPSTARRLVVADATSMDCHLLASVLGNGAGFEVVGSASRAADAAEIIFRLRPDLALISARLQDGPLAGFGVLRELKNTPQNTRVVMLVDEDSPDVVVESFRCGARGIIARNHSSHPDLARCLAVVDKGQMWMNTRQAEYIMSALMSAPVVSVNNRANEPPLSRREMEVAALAATGMSNQEIGTRLSLSPHTIKNNMFRIFAKLGISNRAELVLYMCSPQPSGKLE